MDFDFTWKHPTKSQMALNAMFSNKIKPARLSALQCCDFIATAPHSMWYVEIKRYADGVFPLDITRDSNKFFLEGCNNICSLVEAGYDEENNSWWRVKAPTNDEEVKTANRFILSIANALNTLKITYVRQPLMVELFECLAKIILGNEWENKFNEVVSPKSKTNHRHTKDAHTKPTQKD